MSSDRMAGIRAKIERANEHIHYLTSELQRFLDANLHRYRAILEIDPKTLKGFIRAFDDGMEAPPLRYSVIIGEVIHHLRSSLDHLVWALVTNRHPNPSFKVQFPICETSDKFERACRQGIAKGISGRVLAIIKGVQPYRDSHPRKHPLYALHALSTTDKHKLLIVAFGTMRGAPDFLSIDPGQGNITFTLPSPTIPTIVRPTKDGAEFFHFSLDRHDPTVKMNFNVPCTIAMEQPWIGQLEPVIPRLTQIRDATIKTLKLFEGEF